MHNTWKVFMFELKSILHKKSVVITTLVMCAFFLIATSVPTIMTLFDSKSNTPTETPAVDIGNSGFFLSSDSFSETELAAYFGPDMKMFDSEVSLREAVVSGTIDSGFVIQDPTSYKSIVKNKDMYSVSAQMVSSVMQKINTDRNLLAVGIDPAKVDKASIVNITVNEEILGKDANQSFLISYILMFAVYMLVIMYGAFVSTSVAREKDSRTMEILITSTKPSALIVGKVLANGCAGLIQFGVILTAGFIGYFANSANYPTFIREMLFGGLSLDAIFIFLIFTASGYLLYLFIYASLGSLVSKVEDVGSSVTPVTLLFMVAYLVASLGLNMPNSLMLRIGSFVPFTAILAMPIRYFLTSVPLIELLISLALMIATTWLLAVLSIRIYRLGSLSYGNKLSFVKAIKLLLNEKKV